MLLEHRVSALLQLHLHSRLNIWLQEIRQRQPQDSTTIFKVLGFGAPYIRDLEVIFICCRFKSHCKTLHMAHDMMHITYSSRQHTAFRQAKSGFSNTYKIHTYTRPLIALYTFARMSLRFPVYMFKSGKMYMVKWVQFKLHQELYTSSIFGQVKRSQYGTESLGSREIWEKYI